MINRRMYLNMLFAATFLMGVPGLLQAKTVAPSKASQELDRVKLVGPKTPVQLLEAPPFPTDKSGRLHGNLEDLRTRLRGPRDQRPRGLEEPNTGNKAK
jgi:hypothetical protein